MRFTVAVLITIMSVFLLSSQVSSSSSTGKKENIRRLGEVEIMAMTKRALREYLDERGVDCQGCTKDEYREKVRENVDTPILEVEYDPEVTARVGMDPDNPFVGMNVRDILAGIQDSTDKQRVIQELQKSGMLNQNKNRNKNKH